MLRIGLWVAQVLLAFVFFGAGVFKTTTPMAELAAAVPWIADSGPLVRFIGLAELLGAVGVIVPAATRILPFLTPLAAVGFATIMVLAVPVHLAYGDTQGLPVVLVIFALSAFVAWGRSVEAGRITPRGAPAEPRPTRAAA